MKDQWTFVGGLFLGALIIVLFEAAYSLVDTRCVVEMRRAHVTHQAMGVRATRHGVPACVING